MEKLSNGVYQVREVTYTFPVPSQCGIEAPLNASLTLEVSGEMVVTDGYIDFRDLNPAGPWPRIRNDVREYLAGVGVEPSDPSIIGFTLDLIRVSSRPVVDAWHKDVLFGEYREMWCRFVPKSD